MSLSSKTQDVKKQAIKGFLKVFSCAHAILGLKHGIDPRDRGYKDTLKIIYQGLLKSGGVFREDKVFAAAGTFNRC